MNYSYKIAVVIAVLLCGGIFSYHFIQSDSPLPTPSKPPSSNADRTNDLPQEESPQASGIGDLMSRIRDRIDTHAPADSEETENETLSSADSANNAGDSVEKNHDHAAPNTTEATAPTLTFGHTPSDDDYDEEAVSATLASDRPIERSTEREDRPHTDSSHRRDTDDTSSNLSSSTPATYTIGQGDTFSTIAVKIYGSEQYWTDIALANPFVDPKRLQVGQSIRLPRHDDVLHHTNKPDSLDTGAAIIHVVRSGESLYTIAEWYYHDPNLWRVIFNNNREKLGGNPDRLSAGTILTIPSQHIPAR